MLLSGRAGHLVPGVVLPLFRASLFRLVVAAALLLLRLHLVTAVLFGGSIRCVSHRWKRCRESEGRKKHLHVKTPFNLLFVMGSFNGIAVAAGRCLRQRQDQCDRTLEPG